MQRTTLTERQQEVLAAIHAGRRGTAQPRCGLGETTDTRNQADADRALNARAATAYLSWLRKTRGR